VRVLNDEVVRAARVTPSTIEEVERRERAELERRAATYRAVRPPVPLTGRVVVVVDDGIATGSTARAACHVARAHGGRRVVLAAPAASPHAVRVLGEEADVVVPVLAPPTFRAVGQFYEDFHPTAEAEVVELLRAAAGA
jgi:putative phosphoribosyl transferase